MPNEPAFSAVHGPLTFVSIDLETTGPDNATDHILEFAAGIANVDQPTDAPFLNSIRMLVIPQHTERLTIGAEVLSMHTRLWPEIYDHQKKMKAENKDAYRTTTSQFEEWAVRSHKIYPIFKQWIKSCFGSIETKQMNVAGKNYATFDGRVLERYDPSFGTFFRSMVLDPAILYYEPGDDSLPGLDLCLDRLMRRCGADANICSQVAHLKQGMHSAMNDALAVAMLLRFGLSRNNRGDFEE